MKHKISERQATHRIHTQECLHGNEWLVRSLANHLTHGTSGGPICWGLQHHSLTTHRLERTMGLPLPVVYWPPGYEDNTNRGGKQGLVSCENDGSNLLGAGFNGKLNFIPKWVECIGQVQQLGYLLIGTRSLLYVHLTARSHHTDGSIILNYHMGVGEEHLQVKDHT